MKTFLPTLEHPLGIDIEWMGKEASVACIEFSETDRYFLCQKQINEETTVIGWVCVSSPQSDSSIFLQQFESAIEKGEIISKKEKEHEIWETSETAFKKALRNWQIDIDKKNKCEESRA